jgi:hypothetical protein
LCFHFHICLHYEFWNEVIALLLLFVVIRARYFEHSSVDYIFPEICLNDEYARRNLLFQIMELERNEFWDRFPV